VSVGSHENFLDELLGAKSPFIHCLRLFTPSSKSLRRVAHQRLKSKSRTGAVVFHFVMTKSPAFCTVQMDAGRCCLPSKDGSILAKIHKDSGSKIAKANFGTMQMDAVRCCLPSEDGSILAKVHKHGVSKVAQANSNSSNRQKAAFIKSVVDTTNSSKRSSKNKRKRAARKARKQANSLDIVHPDQEKHIPHEVIKSTILFVDGGNIDNPRISPVLPRGKFRKSQKKKEPKPVHILSLSNGDLSAPHTHLDHPERGLMLPGSPTQIVLVPRYDALKWTAMLEGENSIALADALDAVAQATAGSSIRGDNRIVICNKGCKYSCVGNQACRNRVGVSDMHKALNQVQSVHQRCILSYFRQTEHLFDMHLDTHQVRHIRAAIDLVDAKTFTVPLSKEDHPTTSRYYGAYGCGMNVYLQAHDDNDFTYGVVSAHMRTQYLIKDRPVVHFAFPRLGIAIPLRPGDVLFFNPKEPHCISSRSCNDDNIYNLSLYMKSTNLGLNDNGKALLPAEEKLLSQYNALYKK
jgi:hypothetical protein